MKDSPQASSQSHSHSALALFLTLFFPSHCLPAHNNETNSLASVSLVSLVAALMM